MSKEKLNTKLVLVFFKNSFLLRRGKYIAVSAAKLYFYFSIQLFEFLLKFNIYLRTRSVFKVTIVREALDNITSYIISLCVCQVLFNYTYAKHQACILNLK